MTPVLFLLTGIAVTAIPAAFARGLEAERHHWRLTRLEYLRVDRLYHDKDHCERLARRWERRAVEARQLVGDLTVQLAHTRRRRRSPVPDYGRHRQEVSA